MPALLSRTLDDYSVRSEFSSDASYEMSVGGSTIASGASGVPSRRVKFSAKVKAKKTTHYKNYSEAEKEATWYDQAGLDEIQVEIHLTLKKHDETKDKEEGKEDTKEDESEFDDEEDDEPHCMRGLENRGQLANRLKQQESRNAVMKEQEWQRKHGVNDPSMLSKVYKRTAKLSVKEAYRRAAGDKQIAQAIFREDKSESHAIGNYNACNDRSKALLERRRQRIRQQMSTTATAAAKMERQV